MKLLCMGASGSGTTTLGRALASAILCAHIDVDDYYWEKTEPPFTQKVDLQLRQERLKKAFDCKKNVVVSGSLVSWGEYWESAFDVVVFLRLDPQIRLQRLANRERQRYGVVLEKDENVAKISQDFLDWASRYDDPSFKGRSLAVHLEWLKKTTANVIHLNSEETVKELVKRLIL